MRHNQELFGEFKNKLARNHNLNNYDFTNTIYYNKRTPVTFRCKTHNELITSKPSSLFRLHRKYICTACSEQELLSKWLIEAKTIHGDKYGYEKVTKVNCLTPVIIHCNTHGDFLQNPTDHVNKKYGCRQCVVDEGRLDTNDFIQRARKMHGYKYDYTKSNYTKWNESIVITCPSHGDWETRAGAHLTGSGCLTCVSHASRKDKDSFIKEAREIHGRAYNYENVIYINNKTPVDVDCKRHGIFSIPPNRHLSQKTGCPRCRESLGERRVVAFLERHGIHFIKEYLLADTKYRMDFFLPDFNIFIEFHGIQHYEPVERFGGMDGFLQGRQRDIEKLKVVRSLDIPLIVLSYKTLEKNQLDSKLKFALLNIYKYWFNDITGKLRVFRDIHELALEINWDGDYIYQQVVDKALSEHGYSFVF